MVRILAERKHQAVQDGVIYAFETRDGSLIETKFVERPDQQCQINISCMSGCPVQCRFCATGQMPRSRNLEPPEMEAQVTEMLRLHADRVSGNPADCCVTWLGMGEPFLMIDPVRQTIDRLRVAYPGMRFRVATIGITGSDFSWIGGDVSLQISVQSLSEEHRRDMIPYTGLMRLDALGQIRLPGGEKPIVDVLLVNQAPDMLTLVRYFPPAHFTLQWTPCNPI